MRKQIIIKGKEIKKNRSCHQVYLLLVIGKFVYLQPPTKGGVA